MHLFKPLKLPQNIDFVLPGVANIQTTKGCSHNCSFCALRASERIEYMPFPAIVMFSELLKSSDIYQLNKEDVEHVKLHTKEWDSTIMTWWSGHTETKNIKSLLAALRNTRMLENERVQQCVKTFLVEGTSRPGFLELSASRLIERLGKPICNYYDSEPFDYRDRNFLHRDGTPAHYGDVVALISGGAFYVHITTAGWTKGNAIAKAAAEKIVSLCKDDPYLIINTRVSINPTERVARSDLKRYLENMKEVINTLAPVAPEILFYFDDKGSGFIKTIVEPIVQLAQTLNLRVSRRAISNFSGRSGGIRIETDEDVADCMGGYHIWPSGELSIQGLRVDFGPWKQGDLPKGTRPTPTGHRFW